MLQFLKQFNESNASYIPLTLEFRRDLYWFHTFLKSYNGVTIYYICTTWHQVHLNASLTGLGGIYNDLVYALSIPRGFQEYDIVHLEMINVHIRCGNLAVVKVLISGSARDSILATSARNVRMLTALFNISLVVTHIQGLDNVIADLLSRW